MSQPSLLLVIALVAAVVTAYPSQGDTTIISQRPTILPIAIPADEYILMPKGEDDEGLLKEGVAGEYMGDHRKNHNGYPSKVMFTIPVPNSNYKPRKEVDAQYAVHVDRTNGPYESGLVVADCKFSVTRPTINLDNFPINNIQCDNDEVSVSFKNPAAAQKAFTEWSRTNDFTIMFGYEWNCNGESKTNIRTVSSITMSKDDSLMVVMNTDTINREQLFNNYEINLNQYTDEVAISAVEARLEKNAAIFWNKKIKQVYPLDVNFNRVNNTVTRSNIPVFNTSIVSMSCINCHSQGEAAINVNIRGTLAYVSYYRVQLAGKAKVNMDVLVSIQKQENGDWIETTLFTARLNPVSVPGLFAFNTELKLKAGLSYHSDNNADATPGFDASMVWDWTLESPKGFLSLPKFTNAGAEPILTPHLLKVFEDASVTTSIHLTPEVAIGFKILGIAKFDMNVAFDNSLGAVVKSSESSKCPKKQVSIRLSRQHDIKFDIKSRFYDKRFSVWNTGVKPIACLYCDKCMATSVRGSTISDGTSTNNTAVVPVIETPVTVVDTPVIVPVIPPTGDIVKTVEASPVTALIKHRKRFMYTTPITAKF